MAKKKKLSFSIIFLITSFIVYISLYYSMMNGYYDHLQYNKKVLTEEAMKKFESDVSSGKDVTVEDYLVDTYKDYSNGISKLGLKISTDSSKIVSYAVKKTFGVLNKLFTE